jgi:hypothetical protein
MYEILDQLEGKNSAALEPGVLNELFCDIFVPIRERNLTNSVLLAFVDLEKERDPVLAIIDLPRGHL